VPRILEIVCSVTKMHFAAVARVTDERWVACAVRDDINFGLQPGEELELKTTLCDEIRQSNTRIVIDDVDADPHYCGHHTAVKYGLQSYISVPLRYPDGRFFGTLCAIDPKPAKINNAETIGMFEMFADLIGFHLDAADRLALSEQTLAQIQQDTELHRQFFAVLGHDLRNPLSAIQTSIAALGGVPLTANAQRAVAIIERSTARIGEMIAKLMDSARATLSDGVPSQLASLEVTQTEPVGTGLPSARPSLKQDA
jgi:GAF domain-containing protein